MTRHYVGRARALISALALGLLLVTASWSTLTVTMRPHPETVSPAAPLIVKHGCWVDEPPPDMKDRIPGHVVVTWTPPRGPSHTVYSRSLVGPALDQLFGGVPNGLTVHAFCR